MNLIWFYAWWNAPAFWWQFWMPQSGLRGGMLASTIIATSYYMLDWLINQLI